MSSEQEPTPPSKSDESSGAEGASGEPSPPPNRREPKVESAVQDFQARQAADDQVERSLWKGGYSSKAMVGAWVTCALVTAGLIALALFVEWFTILYALLGAVLVWLVTGAVYAVRRLGIAYELTTQRFIHQTGVLSRRTDRIEVIDIDDVTYRQGPVERLLGVGQIDIESSDRSHPELRMRGIANVREVADLIDDIRRKERRRRSLHIESI
jgi:membrane protein YdbS with pleckstrin-like domain